MELRRIRSDTYGCGNSLGDFVEIVCRCDRCEKHFSAYEKESFDLCGVCVENEEIVDQYNDEAFNESVMTSRIRIVIAPIILFIALKI